VSSHKGDWGRKCQVQRQALSDCSEEKYHPNFIPSFCTLVSWFSWVLRLLSGKGVVRLGWLCSSWGDSVVIAFVVLEDG